MFTMRSKKVVLVLFLPTLTLLFYWSSEMISKHIVSGGQLGKRYISLMNAVKKRSFKVSQTWIKKRCQPILCTQHNILRPRIGMRRTVTENNRTILNIRTEKKVTNYFKLVIGEIDISLLSSTETKIFLSKSRLFFIKTISWKCLSVVQHLYASCLNSFRQYYLSWPFVLR